MPELKEYEFITKVSTVAKFDKKALKSFCDEIKELFHQAGFLCVETKGKEVTK